jgi:hypothetical protein
MFNRSRSPPHQPRDVLQNDQRPLPIGWIRAFSNNVDRGRVYYTNGQQSQWNFPSQAQPERQRDLFIEFIERERQLRIEAERQLRIEAERQLRIEAEQKDHIGLDLRENLEFISNNNNFNQHNMEVLSSISRMILEDNERPINRLTLVPYYITNLESMIYMLRDRNVHSDLKHLCKKLFEEIYEKLAKEKQIIDYGHTTHNEYDTTYLSRELNRLNSIYNRFRNIINNIGD